MLYRFLLVLLFGSGAAIAQDRCLSLTRLPAPERPTDKKVGGDQIWTSLRIEFKSDGTIGKIYPLVSGIDRKLDAQVRDAAKRIAFQPKRVGGQAITVKRDIDYGYIYSKGTWTIRPGAGECVTQTRYLDDEEENRVAAAARSFIEAWAGTHDLRRLEDRYFLPQFTAVIGSPDMAPFSEQILGQLTDSERRSTFMSFWNYAYLLTVIRRSTPKTSECWDQTPECDARRTSFLNSLFPAATADAILNAQRRAQEPTSRAELLSYTTSLGEVFDKALPTFRKLALEQSIEFRSSMDLAEDDYTLNYLIKPSTADQDYRDPSGRVILAKGEKLFSVQTPLLLSLDLIQRGNTYKVFNIAPGDGD